MGHVTTEGFAIGVDVGGTKIAGGLVNLENGHVLVTRSIATRPEQGGAAVLSAALTMARDLMDVAAGKKVIGIGVGVPELVDLSGAVASGQTIDWRGMPVQQEFSRLAPARVESDVRAAALAEALFGAGRNRKTFVYVTVGTGISSCLVQDGNPYAGARGNALVLASGFITQICPSCGDTSRFVLEEYASGPALVQRYNRLTGQTASSAVEVLAKTDASDAAAQVAATAGEALGASVGWLVNVLDPEAVIIGGGLGLAGGLYWSSLVESTRSHIWADNARDLPILPAATGIKAGVIGAAASVARSSR